jgi:hypothetical protein
MISQPSSGDVPMLSPKMLARFISGRLAWARGDLSESDYLITLSQQCLDEMAQVIANIRSSALPTVLLTPDEYPMPECRAAIGKVRQLLDDGPGFALVDRIPVEAMSAAEATALHWLLSSMIARPVAQKLDGTMIYDVWNAGQRATPGSGVRPDKTNIELNYHTDNSYNRLPPEHIGLLCLRPARRGGMSRVISLYSVHNEILSREPQLLPRLYKPYWFDRQREFVDADNPVFFAPIFAFDGKRLSARVSLHQIFGGYALAGEPLDETTKTSLTLLQKIFAEGNFATEFGLHPGRLQYVNNSVVGHSRTGFEDHPDPERKRHVVRLWLRDAGRRCYVG